MSLLDAFSWRGSIARIAPFRAPTALWTWSAVALLVLAACRRNDAPKNNEVVNASGTGTTPAPVTLLAGEQIEIPAGSFNSGTVPGEHQREPTIEPRLTRVTLGSFRIDRLPYPNDPALPPLVNVSRAEAEQRCAAQSKRLCTELEWERACKGPDSATFSGGEKWDAKCAEAPQTCASGFNVLGFGAEREWTASSRDSDKAPLAIARGAEHDAAESARRCAHRIPISGDEHAVDLGFRCCKGAPNAAEVTEPVLGQAFRKVEIPLEQLAKMLAADPHTKVVSESLSYFVEPDAAETVVARGPGEKRGFQFTVLPLLWNPVVGAEFLVVSARSGKDTTFVAVFNVIGDNEYRIAASMILHDEPGPVALAYSNDIRPRLHFSGCWGCLGETGKILYRKPDGAVILQP